MFSMKKHNKSSGCTIGRRNVSVVDAGFLFPFQKIIESHWKELRHWWKCFLQHQYHCSSLVPALGWCVPHCILILPSPLICNADAAITSTTNAIYTFFTMLLLMLLLSALIPIYTFLQCCHWFYCTSYATSTRTASHHIGATTHVQLLVGSPYCPLSSVMLSATAT